MIDIDKIEKSGDKMAETIFAFNNIRRDVDPLRWLLALGRALDAASEWRRIIAEKKQKRLRIIHLTCFAV